MMVTEFSRSVQGFVIGALTRIVHLDGAALSPPSAALGFGNLVNAVTRLDGALIAVVDVEQVLASLEEPSSELSESMMRQVLEQGQQRRRVMVVDDSMVARKQVVNLMHKLNMECVVAQDGREALENLMNADVSAGEEPISLVVSDIEMPLMDGYALTRAIRETPHLRHLKVVLHSSISGIFNEALVREVHADRFVAKFQPDILAAAVMDLLPLPNAQAHMAS
jgi:two-component system chemotaxis response regulator CheV